MDFENIEKSNISQIEEKIRKRLEEQFGDPSPWQERMLYRDVLNFWPVGIRNFLKLMPPDEQKNFLNNLAPIPHYEQGYREKGERDVEALRKDSWDEEAEFHKVYYPKQLERIVEFSDPEQIKKYNELVDKFNADIDRIKKENDIDHLQSYLDEVVKLVDEKK